MTKAAWYHTRVHIPWSEVELFVAVAEAGSLSGAAKALRVTQPTVSRRLAELEALLGEPLFVRNVEGATLTDFGERLLEPARRMAETAGDVDLAATGADPRPRGVVRVTAPPGIAYDLLAPFAVHARQRLPEIDLALRIQALGGPATQRDVVTLASIDFGVGVFATREYVASLPRGYGLADVGWIAWAPPLDNLPPTPQLAAAIPGFRPAFASDDFLVQVRAAEAGVGAIVLGRFRSRRALPTALVEMKVDLGKIRSSLHLVCGRVSLTIPRVRAVADLLAQELRDTVTDARR